MHCIQYIAVKEESKQDAFDTVKCFLEGQMGNDENLSSWYDWFVTGGGRWSTSDDPYDDTYTGDVVHQSEDKFQEYLDTAHKFRLAQLNQHIEDAREINLPDLLDKLEDFEHDHYRVGMDLYSVKKLYDLALGIWDYNSYFFDIINDTTNRKSMLDSIDNGDKNWYLVPVDFHF